MTLGGGTGLFGRAVRAVVHLKHLKVHERAGDAGDISGPPRAACSI